MSAAVSIREVATLAGVSVGTVSNVLNRPDVVATATRERVLAAISQLGFVRNESARQLRSGTARAIGLVVLDVSNPFFTDVARGAEEAATEAGHAVILCNTDESVQKEARHLELLAEQRVHSVLITPADPSLEPVHKLRERGVSVVLLDHPAQLADACSVSVDDRTGGFIAVEHLIAMGHQDIVMVNGNIHRLYQARERHAGAKKAMTEAGRKAGELGMVEVPAFTVAAGLAAGEEILAREPRPTAVFCANDLLALGVLQSMVRAGVRVPDDVAIVGYDDIDFAAAAAVPLSSVRQPRQLIGRTAAELVIAEAHEHGADKLGHHEHQHVVFTPELVVRASSEFQRAKVRHRMTKQSQGR